MDDAAGLIPDAHRSVRWLDAQDSAFAGELVTDGAQLRVRVDADRVSDALWTFAGAGHVAGVRDVVRRVGGQDALLPWCADTVDAFLGRRAAAERPLAAGEMVTLVGSLLRGIAETAEHGVATVAGRWWLADDGRPLFAPGEGSDCAAAAAVIIQGVREACADRAMERTLGEILRGVHDRRVVVREISRWEAELTELAAPRALDREIYPPERVSAIPLHQAHLPQEASRDSRLRSLLLAARAHWDRLRDWLRERWPRRVPRSPEGTASERGRGRMLLIGAAVAGVVLLGGLLWPTGGEDTSATAAARRTEQPSEQPSAPTPTKPESSASATSTPATSAPASDAGDAPRSRGAQPNADAPVEQQATALLRRIAACAESGDARCEGAVVEGAAKSVLDRLSGADGSRAVTPIEDYGDIAVVRLGAAGELGEQMLVIVRQKDGWLVRDVYDVADQPSGAG
ncbi:hypothetical protein [Microbacterium sp. H1-D42]|uniref:hypothetical protein n=1 Tax=Microbacterium sp. H1-D42 TaxID=2925844 RepID=UPI001F52E2E8|nr:hypothetical protein [Microbacterium sp. H1-D42]UNK72385.1 hypothetical protein MNR00_08085 [Microbacterium sp. H1-D42]